MKKTFVETRVFTARLKGRLTDDALRKLQTELLADHEKGAVMPGCGGLRKIRVGEQRRGCGKRGGLRVIYLNIPEAERIDLITVYGKEEQEDLSPAQKKMLRKLVDDLRTEAINAFRRKGSRR